MAEAKDRVKDQGKAKHGSGKAGGLPERETLLVPVRLRRGPLTPWFRFGVLDSQPPRDVDSADLRVLRDFCLHLQVENESWIWCRAIGGSLRVAPGDILFLPPGFVHAWAYVGETHLAIHFDLQRNPRLTLHNYEGSFNMIRYGGGSVEERPRTVMPVFQLLQPGQEAAEAWRIPLITRLPNPAEWQRRLGDLVRRWETRTLETVLSQLRANRVLGWALEELTLAAASNVHLAEDPRIADWLNRLRDPAVLAEVSRQPVVEIARRLGLGETLFRQRFRVMTARNPHQYIRERQVYHACRALEETKHRIKEIAERLGFDDPYHFSRVFTALVGRSPAEYRRRTERTKKTKRTKRTGQQGIPAVL